MEPLNFANTLLKYCLISIIALYVYIKSVNYTSISLNKIILSSFFSFILGFICAILSKYFSFIVLILFLLPLISVYMKLIIKIDLAHSICITFIGLLISFVCYLISLTIVLLIITSPIFDIGVQHPIIILSCSILDFVIINSIFKIKRFSQGFSFLKNNKNIYKFSSIGLILCGNLIIAFTFLTLTENHFIQRFGLIAFALIILGSYIWIKRSITLDYRERMRNREVNMLKEELEAEKEKNVKLNEEISELAKINHKYSSRIRASEESVKKLAYMFNKTNNTEFSNELSDITKLITDLSYQYSNEIASKLKYAKKLPSTNVKGIDSILSHMQKESLDNNIDFELKVNCSVNHLIEKYIPQNRLETLLGDHIKDAIIAINSGNNNLRKIYVIFDIIDNCYQISFYDSGIDFEIDTLINLGLEAITTHKDTGGNGFGFLTTFETLKECKASLIIEEINFKNSNFSKAIHVLFDNNSKYVIKTNRIEDFKNYNISDRIILEEQKNN